MSQWETIIEIFYECYCHVQQSVEDETGIRRVHLLRDIF